MGSGLSIRGVGAVRGSCWDFRPRTFARLRVHLACAIDDHRPLAAGGLAPLEHVREALGQRRQRRILFEPRLVGAHRLVESKETVQSRAHARVALGPARRELDALFGVGERALIVTAAAAARRAVAEESV